MRHPLTASVGTELSEGHFQTAVEQPQLGGKADKVKRLVLTTGKKWPSIWQRRSNRVRKKRNLDEIHIVRIEQLYPFPKQKIEAIIQRYPNLEEMVWVQEEPKKIWEHGTISLHFSLN
ncbi:hypothetical protein GCM10020331_026450 [Ectobacillus funiculus]